MKEQQETQPIFPQILAEQGHVGEGWETSTSDLLPLMPTWDTKWGHTLDPLPLLPASSPLVPSREPPDLNAASQDAGREAPVELGVLFTLRHQVLKLAGQQQLNRVLVHDFDERVPGAQGAQRHRAVLLRRGQAMQEAEQLLDDLNPEPQR